jgi:hypothetical protein
MENGEVKYNEESKMKKHFVSFWGVLKEAE